MTTVQHIKSSVFNRWMKNKSTWNSGAALLLGCTGWFAPVAIAQERASSKSPAIPESTTSSVLPPISAVDAWVPVITMEAIGNGMNNLQSFRVQIFKGGQVRFQGFRGTKVLGAAQTLIQPEQVQRIQTEFSKYGFWKMPAYDFQLQGSLSFIFTLRDGYTEKTVRSNSIGPNPVWRKAIEDEVNTAQWRCDGIKDSVASEQCDHFSRSQEEGVETFLRLYAEKHIRRYK